MPKILIDLSDEDYRFLRERFDYDYIVFVNHLVTKKIEKIRNKEKQDTPNLIRCPHCGRSDFYLIEQLTNYRDVTSIQDGKYRLINTEPEYDYATRELLKNDSGDIKLRCNHCNNEWFDKRMIIDESIPV